MILLALSACGEKVATFKAEVVDDLGDPIHEAEITFEVNDKMIPTYEEDALTADLVEQINKGDIWKEVYTDSLGEFLVAFSDSYFLFPDKYKIHITKEGFQESVIDVTWNAATDSIIILKKQPTTNI